MSTHLLIILILAICMCSPAGHAEEYRFDKGKIVVTDIWARASDGEESAVFMTIRNDGELEKLAWVEPAFGDGGAVEVVDEDVELLDSIPLPGGGVVTELNPASRYVMTLQLTKPLRDGTTIPMNITFKEAGTHEIRVPIRAAASRVVAKCQVKSLLECGKLRFRRQFERRPEGR